MKTNEIKTIEQRPSEEVYLEWFNDWLSVSAMADHYDVTELKMYQIIRKGQLEHKNK